MIIVLQTLVFFRESLIAALDRIFRPYLKHFALTFKRNNNVSDDEDSEDHVYAEFDDEKGVIFYPPVYAQRYAAVSDCLMDERWCGMLEKVVDFGYHDMSFIKYLKDVPGIKHILGVDIESIPLRCSSDLLGSDEYMPKRESPLHVSLFQGSAADPDYRLIGCDAVIAIEMIEHMYPQDLERLVHTIFGFIKPWIAIITTPNGDFNPLFKSMEKNGFRRLDHFFEWSREQFHDWCSNIVLRYPHYTVSCRGVGPGPPGTIQYGCCSQLALFVSKDYHKQQDLNLNSLALVAKGPSNNTCDVQAVDIPDNENYDMYSANNIESYTELMFSNKQSCVTIVLSPVFSFESVEYPEYRDKMSQCNLDKEIGKNFLMYNEEDICEVVVPRRPKTNNRVYVIEDVNSRLNCTTLQVKKFSKKTQYLMAKNSIPSLVHTKEVVDDIRHLTKMLNFNTESREQADGDFIWRNINWGVDAPYWNQYYQIVREYTYPVEAKSEESQILDLISDEINRFVDLQCDEDFAADMNKIEIPLDHLMRVVHHITDDVDKVKDLLEWNGYEVSDGVVIYSRLVLDTTSVNSHDDGWRDSDISDWDTDVHSTSLSNGSTIGAEYHGRNLYCALDQKVRKLRSMMSNNEDISVELDRVVCRLMKLALRTARQRERSLSYRWMQCKLFDLLNLSEKAIEKKRQMFAEFNQPKAICCDDNQFIPEVDIAKIKTDETANEIVNKYRYLVFSPDKSNRSEEMRNQYYDAMEDEFVNDFLKDSASMELSFEDITRSPALVDIEPIISVYPRIQYFNPKETPLSRTKAWIDEDVNLVVYSQNSDQGISSGDTDHSACNIARYKHHKDSKKRKKSVEGKDLDVKRRKRTQSKTSHGKRNKNRKNDDNPQSKGKTSKTILKKRSSYNIIIKTSIKKQISAVNIGQFGHYFLKAKKNLKRHTHDTGSRPISKTLIELCNPENKKKDYNLPVQESTSNSIASPNIECSIAATKESLHIGIVTENNEETIALRRTIGTDPEDETTFIEFEPDDIHGSMTNIMNLDSFCNKADCGFENIHSQTLFLYDINEPSTSKGVRRVSLDVQCGSETNHKYAMLSTNTSLAKMPEIFNAGLKIENSCSDVRRNITNCDFGTCTNEIFDSFKTISPKQRYTGIKIKDSVTKITEKNESGTMTQAYEMPPVPKNSAISSPETTMLKPISSYLKVDDSGSELCDSLCSSQRSALHFMKYAKDAREIQTKLTVSKDVGEEHKFTQKYTRPKLTNGGVYVHSYKERQVSEDVVYHGEWQKHIPVPTQKKKNCNVVSKITPEANKIIKANFKENVTANIIVKPKTRVKDLPPKNTYLKDVKKGQYTDQVKKSSTSNVADIKNCYRNTKKVTSKFTVRPVVVKKSHHILKKPSKTSTAVKKDSEIAPKLRKKSYIPVYLKRKLSNIKLHKLQTENALKETVSGNNKTDFNVTEGINKSLINVEFTPRENLSFVVFQNEVVNNKSNVNCSADGERLIETEHFIDNITDNCNTRSLSPQSLNSSPDSSSTVATVRVRPTTKLSDRRHSNPSNKSNSGISQIENTPVQTKKGTRCKSARRYQDKVSDNKENLPETSKINNRNNSSTFTKNKNVFRAQIATDNPPSKSNNTINKRKSINKSNIKIPSIPIGKQSISGTSCRPSVSKKRSIKSRASLSPDNKSMNDSITSNPVATPTTSQASDKGKTNDIINIVDNNQLTEWLDSTHINVVDNKTSMLNAMRELVEERLDFIEKMPDHNAEIDFRTSPMSENCDSIPVSDTASFYDASSFNSSYGTVMGFNDLDYAQIMDFDNTEMGFNDLDHAHIMDFDRTVIGFNDLDHAQVMDVDNFFFDSVVYNKFDPVLGNDSTIGISGMKRNVSDLEALSFKSISAASKMSEYYLAESSMNNVCASSCDPPNLNMPTHNSVRDIFERKPHPTLQSTAGPLAAQAFSGLSMNAASVTGDQPDPVNLVDSETGSGAREFARQATSEEVFISGRSSESYESCLIDDDTVVPNWLFQIISRQRSVQEEDEDEDEEEESDDLASNQMPLEQPVYDMNGNTVEPGMGASAGAGDGRGIHSDHSQDSSGRGTSLSSTAPSSPHSEPAYDMNGNTVGPGMETSAGHSDHSQDSSGRGTSLSSTASSSPYSEAIIIDPTAFTTQLDLTREPNSSSVLVPLLPMRMEAADTSHAIVAGPRNTRNPVLNSSGDPQIDPIPATSDVDADISSTDTDVPDSSDN